MKSVNPLHVFAGITNYIDVGLQVATDVMDTPGGGNGTNGPERLGGGAAPGSAAIGASWQVTMRVEHVNLRGKHVNSMCAREQEFP